MWSCSCPSSITMHHDDPGPTPACGCRTEGEVVLPSSCNWMLSKSVVGSHSEAEFFTDGGGRYRAIRSAVVRGPSRSDRRVVEGRHRRRAGTVQGRVRLNSVGEGHRACPTRCGGHASPARLGRGTSSCGFESRRRSCSLRRGKSRWARDATQIARDCLSARAHPSSVRRRDGRPAVKAAPRRRGCASTRRVRGGHALPAVRPASSQSSRATTLRQPARHHRGDRGSTGGC